MAELPVELAADGPYLTGRLAGQTADSLRVRVAVGARQVGFLTEDLRQEVRIPAVEVVQIERRQFSRGRTALFVAGGAGAAAAVFTLIKDSVTGGGDPDGGEDFARIPLFSVSIP
jgi:hypothetical protein